MGPHSLGKGEVVASQERWSKRGELVHETSQRPHVGAGIVLALLHDFRGEVQGRADGGVGEGRLRTRRGVTWRWSNVCTHHRAWGTHLWTQHTAQAKVADLYVAVGIQENVRALDVTVKDARVVNVLKPSGDANEDVPQGLFREMPAQQTP